MNRLRRGSLLAVAGLQLFGAALHAWWFWLIPTLPEASGLNESVQDLLSLYGWAITLFLTLFAALIAWVAVDPGFSRRQVRIVTWGIATFWIARLVLEAFFPVRLALFTNHPSPWFVGLIVVGVALLVAPDLRRGSTDRLESESSNRG